MLLRLDEQDLCLQLRDLPRKFDHKYSDEARRELLELLFKSLSRGGEYLGLFFPDGPPSSPSKAWSLRDAQGAVEGAEYTEAARGKPCGHIFKSGEASYRCRTCTTDDTCVLCARCFDSSDHEGHTVEVSVSPGNSGCCDCGDDEAWIRPVHCSIHSAAPQFESKAAGKAKEGSTLPEELQRSIRLTIARALDYLIDVFSCSPEQLRLPKTEESILADERTSRLTSKWYGEGDLLYPNQQFALVLWNDEKHTIHDVQDQVARACKQRKQFGLSKAREVDEVGRSVVHYSKDIKDLLRMAKIIEEIKLTVTIRSARDTFREQMCGTIIEWISDISGCSVGHDSNILRHTVCEEMLKPWRIGSEATHQQIGQDGIDDHEIEDREPDIALMARMISRQRRQQRLEQRRAEAIARQRRREANPDGTAAPEDGTEDDMEDEDEEEGDDMDLAEGESAADASNPPEEMEIDEFLAQDDDAEMDMEPWADSDNEALEVSEATIAGYPPPPPPPPAPAATPAEPEGDPLLNAPQFSHVEPSLIVPTTPRSAPLPLRRPRPSRYWLEKPESYGRRAGTPVQEDLWQRLRLDFLILFDLRMWKKLRIDIRNVFICTVVTLPHFKRLLGLRFAGVYTTLAQLYLIADREPDHSIINLSLQMLTTPSITAEVVERGNFLTNLMAILYTFLTTRQVGYPWDVDSKATLAFEQGAVTNRRMYHFFMDMKYLLASEHVQGRIREETRYLQQFLDLVKLHQGICPNVRAVGEHIEYETDTWISASLITREINKLCRQFADAFSWQPGEPADQIRRAIRWTAKVAIINSLGAERLRFDQHEIKTETFFKTLDVFEFDADSASLFGPTYRVVDFVVSKEAMSFHHALHYTLSWLIDRARGMPRDQLHGLLLFSCQELKEPYPPAGAIIPNYQPDEYLLALFDFPLRVCAWLSQMRAGMWVRNGITLRHQMSQYRNVTQRDVSYQRDIFLLQTALVICDPSVFLATMIDRFGLMHWIKGDFKDPADFEDAQVIEVAEDFVHLLIILLCDRTSLIPVEDAREHLVNSIRRDIAHILCFKPLSFSELTARLSDKVQNTDEFTDVLSEMTRFRPPEGLSDTGSFELKEQYLDLVDPYILQYTRNQREEAETVYRNYLAKKTGKPASDIVFEPKLQPISFGVFQDLAHFTQTPLFTQVVYYLLGYALIAKQTTPQIPLTRVEGYVQFVLQLILVAVLEDKSQQHDWSEPAPGSFVTSVLSKSASVGIPQHPTVLSLLKAITEIEEFKSCEAKVKLILHRLRQRQPNTFIIASEALHMRVDRTETASPASIAQQDKELKKKQALERAARVMSAFKEQQSQFLANQDINWGEEDFSDSDEDIHTPPEQEKIVKYPSGTCILCQEETNDQRLFGIFGYVSESTILRTTDVTDGDWVDEVAQTPTSLDRSADDIRPFGVAGRNRRKVEKVNANGETIIAERQELGKGFPADQVRRGPVTIGCGHVMHYSCFEVYIGATQRRHVSQIARNHPERPDLKEFICPLCKALGNIFLPIIWKGKAVTYPGVLESEVSFDDWIQSKVAVNMARLDKSPERGTAPSNFSRPLKLLFEYANQEFIPSVASQLRSLVTDSNLASISGPRVPLARYASAGFLPVLDSDPIGLSSDPAGFSSEGSAIVHENFSMLELTKVYQRLRDTFRANKIATGSVHPSLPQEDLTSTDTLARTLGFSIAALEIAQRGVESEHPRGTLLDKISPQALTHLRVYSETVSSYIAIGSIRAQGQTMAAKEYLDTQQGQLRQLFHGHPAIFDDGHTDPLDYGLKKIQPILAQDPFVFLSECSVCAVPGLNLDIHHILRLCYVAEIVRVIFAFTYDETRDDPLAINLADKSKVTSEPEAGFSLPFRDYQPLIQQDATQNWTNEQLNNLHGLVSRIISSSELCRSAFEGDDGGHSLQDRLGDPLFFAFLHKMISAYALPFLRKAAILMHVRYGLEFPHVPHELANEPETVRLSYLLKLPCLDEIVSSIVNPTKDGYAMQSIIHGWIKHWFWAREGQRPVRPMISLSHPAIFELVGLPKNYDTLTDEAIRRRCPTTGKDLTDPCVCLFCGEIFCGQSVCCMKDGHLGGCFQHQERCGGNIGMYINIRKCMVLFLNLRNGTWAIAPYLDKHGEVDPTLRRRHQLFLNQKRYDALLRKVWLNHEVPSTIARRLEGDVNNGGWETL